MIDYYKVLNVSPDASLDALNEQRRFLLNAFHPDKFSSPGQEKNLAKALEKTKEINAAWDVLKTPASRSDYDRQRAAEKERQRAATAPPPQPQRPAQNPQPPPPRPAAGATAPEAAVKSKSTPAEEEEAIKYCLEIMRETGQASATLFQRRFRIGYARAARLIAMLESRGIVGPDQGSNEREILVDLGPRPRPVSSQAPAPVSVPATQNLENERRRLLAEQQLLQAQLRLQQVAAARPIARRRRPLLANFGCLQGCGCLILGVVGLMFFSALSRSCTQTKNTPPVAVTDTSTQTLPAAPLNPGSGSSSPSPAVRRALPVFSSGSTASSQRVLPANTTVSGFYAVTGIAKNDALNVHGGPGSNYEVIAKLPNGYQGVQIVGASVMNGTTEWVQINFKNQSGWVTKAYLKAQQP